MIFKMGVMRKSRLGNSVTELLFHKSSRIFRIILFGLPQIFNALKSILLYITKNAPADVDRKITIFSNAHLMKIFKNNRGNKGQFLNLPHALRYAVYHISVQS